MGGEVRKLADTTKEQLSGMQDFVKEIYEASGSGKASVEKVLESTEEMSVKMDAVSETVGANIEMLQQVVETVEQINDNMQIIKEATTEVNTAMEQCSKDAEELTHMSCRVNDSATESVKYAQGIEEIDRKLSGTTKMMYANVHKGITIISNDEVVEALESTEESHRDWVTKVSGMVSKMEVGPVQVNPDKCAFGHFYNTIEITNPALVQDWEKIGSLHAKLHRMGAEILQYVLDKKAESAESELHECEQVSLQVINELENLKNKIREMSEHNEIVC